MMKRKKNDLRTCDERSRLHRVLLHLRVPGREQDSDRRGGGFEGRGG